MHVEMSYFQFGFHSAQSFYNPNLAPVAQCKELGQI